MLQKLMLLLILPLTFALSGCNDHSTASDQVAVHEQDGVFSDKELIDCIPPESKGRSGLSENHYYYPTNTRNYRALPAEDAEAPPFQVVSNDNAEMRVPMTITFTLKTDCDSLLEFHRELGNRFNASSTDNENVPGDGWVEMLDFVMGVPADTLLDRIAQEHDWRNLWNDPGTKAEVERALKQQLPGMVRQQAGGEFFQIHNVLVLKPEPVDDNLTRAINQEQSSVATANAQEAQAAADEARANAQIAVAKAEAEKKRQEILGFQLQGMTPEEAVRAYNESQLIAKGQNPYQPQYVVPGIPR